MAIIKDKLAGTSRESMRQSAYRTGKPEDAGFESEPEQATKSDDAKRAREAEKYCYGTPDGVNVYTGKK